ncbi:MAG: DNA adenine methylase [Blastochloris sp.]|nr:DNA adenine methylase [Blastochloris sp.]
MADLFDLFESLESQTKAPPKNREGIIRAPFAYPGSKMRSVRHILPKLPVYDAYVEPFGGSGVILLNRPPVKLEVLNDRYMGVVAFYRCLASSAKLEQLVERIEYTVCAREDFQFCKETWRDCTDDIERAFRWYYTIVNSFGGLSRNFGRATGSNTTAGKLREKIPHLRKVHERLKKVYIENQDWRTCIKDYDSLNTVFYIDPPYLESSAGVYKSEMSQAEHSELLDTVHSCEGFCAVSAYPNALYDSYPWDEVIDWEVFVSIKSQAYTDTNGKESFKGIEDRNHRTERLYIKESK